MPITESEYLTASKWAKRRQQKSLLDIDPNNRGGNVDAIDPIRQLERLIDLRVGIQRKKKCADQEIERGAAHRETANFHSLQINGGTPFRRLKSRVDLSRFFALNQLRQQPVRFHTGTVPDLQKVDERVAVRSIVSQIDPGLPKSLRHNLRRFDAGPGIQFDRRNHKHRAWFRLAALNDVELASNRFGPRIDGWRGRQCH